MKEQPSSTDAEKEAAYERELARLQAEALPRVLAIRESRQITGEDLAIRVY